MRRQNGLDEGQAPTEGVDGGKSVMARKYFGTDGIRGSANSHPMTSVVALKVAWPQASSSPTAPIAIAW